MSGAETSLSGTDNNSLALKYTPGYESVFINGVLQVRGSDYVATTGTTVTGLTALTASDVVMVESIIAYSVGDTYTQTQISSLLDAKSPVSTTGAVLLNTTTLSAVTSVSIDNCFSATYDNYLIISTLTSASTGLALNIRFRVSSADNSTANYNWCGQYQQNTTTTIGGEQATGATSGQISGIGVGDGTVFVDISNPFLTKTTHWYGHNFDGTYRRDYAGKLNVTTSYTGFTLIYAQPMTGTIKVYGYK